MSAEKTAQALTAITDEGIFEQLATAILREADPMENKWLHDPSKVEPRNPHQIISQFVEGSLSRAAAMTKEHPPMVYRQALRALSGEMLANRQIELGWSEVSSWAGLQGESLGLLGRLAYHGELIRFTGSSDDQRLLFRHDRVRDWLLADAAAELERRDLLAEHENL